MNGELSIKNEENHSVKKMKVHSNYAYLDWKKSLKYRNVTANNSGFMDTPHIKSNLLEYLEDVMLLSSWHDILQAKLLPLIEMSYKILNVFLVKKHAQ